MIVPLLRTLTQPFRERLRYFTPISAGPTPPGEPPAGDGLKIGGNNLVRRQERRTMFPLTNVTLEFNGECVIPEQIGRCEEGRIVLESDVYCGPTSCESTMNLEVLFHRMESEVRGSKGSLRYQKGVE
jgi:hypothetical protein